MRLNWIFHKNGSAKKVHNQLAEIFELMGVRQKILSNIKNSFVTKKEENLKSNKFIKNQKKILLGEAQE
jgi:hypothetical protein